MIRKIFCIPLLLGTMFLASCPDGGAEEVGEEIDEAAEDVEEAVDDAVDDNN